MCRCSLVPSSGIQQQWQLQPWGAAMAGVDNHSSEYHTTTTAAATAPTGGGSSLLLLLVYLVYMKEKKIGARGVISYVFDDYSSRETKRRSRGPDPTPRGGRYLGTGRGRTRQQATSKRSSPRFGTPDTHKRWSFYEAIRRNKDNAPERTDC